MTQLSNTHSYPYVDCLENGSKDKDVRLQSVMSELIYKILYIRVLLLIVLKL